MKRFKKLLIIILCFSFCLVLSSCGRKITPNEPFDLADGVVYEGYKAMEFTVCSYNIKGGEATIESIYKVKENIE